MPTPTVGQDIEDVCARCGESWHVVMAKLGERIAKVVCKRCGSQHNYRGAGAAAEPNPSTASGARRFTVKRKATHGAHEPPAPPPFDPSKPPRPYSPKDTYASGERVEHPTFGTGVVAGMPGPGKVDVVFPSGARTLAAAKAISSLERPVAVKVPIADRPPDKP